VPAMPVLFQLDAAADSEGEFPVFAASSVGARSVGVDARDPGSDQTGGRSMAHFDLIPDTTPGIGIAASHRRTVAAILHAVGQDLFTATEADMLIDRVCPLVTASPGAALIGSSLSVEDGHPSGHDRHVPRVPHQSG
jgi:hypothetical protein